MLAREREDFKRLKPGVLSWCLCSLRLCLANELLTDVTHGCPPPRLMWVGLEAVATERAARARKMRRRVVNCIVELEDLECRRSRCGYLGYQDDLQMPSSRHYLRKDIDFSTAFEQRSDDQL